MTMTGFVDVHAHFVPDWYADLARDAGHQFPDGMPSWPRWSSEAHLELMDRCDIRNAILSLSSPGVHFGDDPAARVLARKVNDFAAEAAKDHPSRFGFFASLPLPDVDSALAEIDYAIDVLGADGVILETNQAGIYLGNELMEPVFAELDRRGAVVLVHPTSPVCWRQCGLGRPRPMIEFIFETARAITDLLFSDTLHRYSELKMIVPHCGGAIPVLADRISGFMRIAPVSDSPTTDVIAQLRALYYDIAGTPFPRQINALLNLVETTQVLFGSDYPWTPAAAVEQHATSVANAPAPIPRTTWQALTAANAQRLLPWLAGA